MNHAGDLLSAFFDDELAADQRTAVAAHLDDCVDCRRELEDIQTAAVAVRGLPELDPPMSLAPKAAPWQRRRRLQVAGASLAGAAALAALVVGVAVIGSDGGDPQLSAADTVPVVLPGLDPVPAGDRTISGHERVQAVEAALSTMPEVDDMEMEADDMTAEVEVMMDDDAMKVRSGLWDGVAGEYVALMTPAEGVVGLWVANEDGAVMAFFFCEHSWYRVETSSGKTPDMAAVTHLRSALGCSG